MAVKIPEIHHTGVRIDDDAKLLNATKDFYANVMGLGSDSGRPTIPGIPGAWINVGEVGQIHLIGGDQPRRWPRDRARIRRGRTSPTPWRTSSRPGPSSSAWA